MFYCTSVAKHVVMRMNVAAPVKLKNLGSTQFDWQYICTIDLHYYNTQVSIFTNDHFWPMPLPFLSNALSLTPLIHCSLSLSLSLSLPLHSLPTLFSLVVISHRYSWWFYETASLNKLDWMNTVVTLKGLLTIQA